MNKLGNSVFSAVGTLLSIFFSLIVAYAAFGIFDLNTFKDVGFICTFLGFNLIVIIVLSTFGKAVAEKCGTPALASSWVVTVIYTVIQMISSFYYLIFGNSETSSSFYILGNLILAFILLLVMLPILSFGAKHERDK